MTILDTSSSSNLASSAINAGMDVVYGEYHSEMQTTFSEMQRAIEGAQPGQISGVVLEIPTNTQDLFAPETLQGMSREDWLETFSQRETQNIIAEA